MIYFIAIIYCLFLIYTYDIKKRKQGFSFHYYALLIYVICVVGFSYRLGMDSTGYATYFERMDTDLFYVLHHIDEYRYEPLYVIIECIAKNIWDDFACLQLIVAIFVNGVIFWFLRKYSPMFFFSILIYFLFNFWNYNFEIKRESIAVSLFLIAINQMISRDITWKSYLRYLLFLVPVFFSHKFGFITIFFPFFFNLRISKRFYLFTIIFFITALVASAYFKDLLFTISKLLNIYGQEAGTGYLNSDVYGEGGVTMVGVLTGIILPILVLHCANKECNPRIMSMSLFWVLIVILQSVIFIFYRLTNYLFPFVCISYACLFMRICKKENKIKLYVILLLSVISLQVFLISHKNRYIRYYPYSSIFTKEINKDREAEFDRIDLEFNN